MKPESRRALMELISFGMEEISSEDAAPLLAQINECSECAGQWVLIHKTIDTLSHVGETDVSTQKSQQMWLVCMEHAAHKKPSAAQMKDGHLIASSEIVTAEIASSEDKAKADEQSGVEKLVKQLEELRTPLVFLAPQLSLAMASGAMLMMFRA